MTIEVIPSDTHSVIRYYLALCGSGFRNQRMRETHTLFEIIMFVSDRTRKVAGMIMPKSCQDIRYSYHLAPKLVVSTGKMFIQSRSIIGSEHNV